MFKKVLYVFIILITLISSSFIYLKTVHTEPKEGIVNIDKNILTNKDESDNEEKEEKDITAFSSTTCFKKTYYINADDVNMYSEKDESKGKVICKLKNDDIVVAYDEKNGYIYCEDNKRHKGWIKKNNHNLKGNIDKKSQFCLEVSLTEQKLQVIKKDKLIKEMLCSTGVPGNPDTETPVGKFYLTVKGPQFYSEKYKQGGKYYIQFFSDYLIHSVPIDKKGNIIEEERKKLGLPVSHGCIRVSINDAKWLYDNIPMDSVINIHY